MTDYFVVEPCTTANGFEIKLKGKKIDLAKAEKAMSPLGKALVTSSVVMLAKVKDYSLSVYASGRVMMKSEKKMNKKDATKIAKEIISAFEKGGAII